MLLIFIGRPSGDLCAGNIWFLILAFELTLSRLMAKDGSFSRPGSLRKKMKKKRKSSIDVSGFASAQRLISDTWAIFPGPPARDWSLMLTEADALLWQGMLSTFSRHKAVLA